MGAARSVVRLRPPTWAGQEAHAARVVPASWQEALYAAVLL